VSPGPACGTGTLSPRWDTAAAGLGAGWAVWAGRGLLDAPLLSAPCPLFFHLSLFFLTCSPAPVPSARTRSRAQPRCSLPPAPASPHTKQGANSPFPGPDPPGNPTCRAPHRQWRSMDGAEPRDRPPIPQHLASPLHPGPTHAGVSTPQPAATRPGAAHGGTFTPRVPTPTFPSPDQSSPGSVRGSRCVCLSVADLGSTGGGSR